MESDTEFIDSNLQESIAEAVHEYAREKQLEGVSNHYHDTIPRRLD